MDDLRQAAQQALEALETNQPVNYCMNNNGEKFPMMQEDPFRFERNSKAITALRTALEQQQAEPPPEWPLIKNILAVFGLDAIAFVAEWQAAKRPWVGLTDEDVNRESAPITSQMKLAFHAGMYVAQNILKERNND